MALPSILKNMMLFEDGVSYAGEAESVTLPKLSRKTDNWRGGGMNGAAKIDLGLDDDAMKAEWTIGGFNTDVMKSLGIGDISGSQLRFAGALENDDTGVITAVEVVMRGRHQEVDHGEQKVAEKNVTKITTNCTYYKLTVNGQTHTEVDILNFVHTVNGVDLLADQRKALGI